MRKVIMGAAAAAMLAGSSMANAAPVARQASPVAKSDSLHGGELWLAILAAGLLAFILFQINENGNETLPLSP
ncbi:MAG: hypothetical protein ABIT09_11425 [Croceibacterium sp.]